MDLDYKKYRWFFTKSGKLVVGGKSAEQNDNLIKKIKQKNKNYIVMHTKEPGSPFSIILSEKKPAKSDIQETAVFTASFSRAWKSLKKKAKVDVFHLKDMHKSRLMKTGTWSVREKIKSINAPLELALTIQKERLRAVPEDTAKKKEILLKIRPGKKDKTLLLPKIKEYLKSPENEEILSALPPGGIKIVSK